MLLELRTGAAPEFAAYLRVARGSVDNCWCGRAIKCVSLVGDELIEGGLVCLVELRRGGEVGFIRYSNEYRPKVTYSHTGRALTLLVHPLWLVSPNAMACPPRIAIFFLFSNHQNLNICFLHYLWLIFLRVNTSYLR